jgi:hypothetical protein
MGTQNAANPVHRDNGYTFRENFKAINEQYIATLPYIYSDKRATKAHDLLLAKLAVLSSVVTTNDYRLSSLNTTCKEYSKSALNVNRFNKFFDMMMKEIRQ